MLMNSRGGPLLEKGKKRQETTTLEGIMIAFKTFCKTLRADRFGSVQFDT